MTHAEQELEKRFHAALKRDAAHAPDWMTRWDYQRIVKKRKRKAEADVIEDFTQFGGAADLPRWMDWFRTDYPDYIADERIGPRTEESRKNDAHILKALGQPFKEDHYDKRVGLNNAHDHLIPQLLPVPERNRLKTVLDFGAGYGRQANLWTTQDPALCYVGMDAIVNSYCLQHLYYEALAAGRIHDYIDDPANFRFTPGTAGIHHIPTWRSDLIPDNSVELVLCVQVLPELNAKLVKHMLAEFHRILKPGGALYIRDHAYTWKPTGSFDVEQHLAGHGFELAFKAHVINDTDIHGIPRIWRKTDPRVLAARTRTLKHKIEQTVVDIDTLTGGGFKRAVRKFKGK
jgi:SAM-dependent methyltransferase